MAGLTVLSLCFTHSTDTHTHTQEKRGENIPLSSILRGSGRDQPLRAQGRDITVL